MKVLNEEPLLMCKEFLKEVTVQIIITLYLINRKNPLKKDCIIDYHK